MSELKAEGPRDIQMSRSAVHQHHIYRLFTIGDSPRSGEWWQHTDNDTEKWWFGQPWEASESIWHDLST